MKLTFDLDRLLPLESEENVNMLGRILVLFLEVNVVGPTCDALPHNDEWNVVTDTPRPLLVAVMGDGIYDHRPRWNHIRHRGSGLDVLWHHDCDLTILFHKEGENGFTIVNAGSSFNRWSIEDLDDPRNDPAYDPFK